ncbi:response regulator transcription factor [Clostridium ganghwense]|uniref:Stage 0 sporulation protein A homolog n=1 Tax=Clostridium ganghwense TaxID=312089 RepID=A0ABT4CJ75_9CLOT|nr:response regulator transcription factor [Clostridium ganghwense]MCY6369099.1 response regulator transcription factor [Clostridium ganghwense]
MFYNIYLVEDEENLNNILTSYLEKEVWKVTSFLNGREAEEAIKNQPHLWILDIMLPDMDGYELIRKIKADNNDIPVIFISARDEDLDRILGLEMGSDDYLAKPFLPRELVIRTKKLLKRIYNNDNSINKSKIIKIDEYYIDEEKRSVKENDKEIDITSKEFDLLILFIKNSSTAFSREQILDKIWGQDYFGNDRVVDDLIRRLRKKAPKLKIETIYGYGYRLCE